jgi:tetratricopeptide (TPR) repeat protein
MQQGVCHALLHLFNIARGTRMTISAAEYPMPILAESNPAPVIEFASATAISTVVPPSASRQIIRMFQNPRVLEKDERTHLIAELKKAVDLAPDVAEVRVLLGMALCVDLQAEDALEHLRIAAQLAPQSFIARLKYGELLMRLRICSQAAEETHQAEILAANAAQAELARRQAATLRTMLREGVERGGFHRLLPRLLPFRRKNIEQRSAPVALGSN